MAVIVGVRVFDLHIPYASSLKEKRFALRSVKDRVANRYNASLAETGHQDKWQRAEIAVAVVGGERQRVERTLDAIRTLFDEAEGIRVIECRTEIG